MDLSEHKSLLHQIKADDPDKIKAIGDLLPGMVHINRKGDFMLQYMNTVGQELTGITSIGIKEDPDLEIQKHLHPGNMALARKKIRKFEQENNETEILTFFQYIRPDPGKDYRWFFSLKRHLNTENTFTIAILLDEMDGFAKVLRPFVESTYLTSNNYRKFELLTRREKEILKMICLGLTSPEIADQLFISLHTVNTHRKTIKSKLQARNYLEVVKLGELFLFSSHS